MAHSKLGWTAFVLRGLCAVPQFVSANQNPFPNWFCVLDAENDLFSMPIAQLATADTDLGAFGRRRFTLQYDVSYYTHMRFLSVIKNCVMTFVFCDYWHPIGHVSHCKPHSKTKNCELLQCLFAKLK